ncbi:MAG: penicillin-binding transpeptidase domain-containing protein [Actinomycetota bacterium]
MPRAVTRTALLLVLALLSSACGLFESDDPTDDAEAFARALSRGDLTAVPVVEGSGQQAQTWWETVREGMDVSELRVQVESVEETEDRATARLAHTWVLDADGTSWSYDTSVDLVRRDDTWAVELQPSAVAPDLAEGERLRVTSIAAERADILGAGGRALVTDRPVVRFGVDKTLVPPARQAASARALGKLLDVDADDLVQRVEASGERAFVEALVLRQEDVTARIGSGYKAIEGARGIPDEMPLAPTREFARPILGTVGPVTAEMVEESGGDYAAGDVAGLSGLQQRYDERLRGTPGVKVEAVTDESEARVLFEEAATPGKPLRTTLDVDAQAAAERILAKVGPASAVVALRPSTGDLVAAASGPGAEGYSTATLGQYPPGSTFKVVSALALLRAGTSPGDPVPCTRTTTVDGKQFKNYSDYPASSLGKVPLREAFAQSCNTAFVSQHARIEPARLREAAAALGLGQDADLGFPVYLGQVPADGSTTEHAAALIGQGRVLASPIAMASVAGSVAAGRTVVPRLVVGEEATAAPEQPLTEQEARTLQQLMAAVVTDGSGSVLADLPGPQVLAKTGTAEFGEAEPPQTHAWMIAAQGDLAVAVFVEVGESGSRTAGPLLEEFLATVD